MAPMDLDGVDGHEEQIPLIPGNQSPIPAEAEHHIQFGRRRFITLCILLILFVDVGLYLQIIPLFKVLETNICHRFYPDLKELSVPPTSLFREDLRCKDKRVQGELSIILGWQKTFENIPGLLLAIPYGVAADKYGRKAILGLAAIGIILQTMWYEVVCWWPEIFPPRLVWLAPAFWSIGGGSQVAVAMIFVLVADVVSEAERANVFFRLGAAGLLGELFASPLASILMERNPWLPIFLGLGILCCGCCIYFLLPETKDLRAQKKSQQARDLANKRNWRDTILDGISTVRDALPFLLCNWHLVLLSFNFIITSLGRSTQEMLMQYVTKRYGWTWSAAGLLLSLRAFCNLILLIVILPAASHLLITKCGMKGQTKDLWISRASIILLCLGSFSIGLSGTPVIMAGGVALLALGSGFNLLLRSLLTSIIERHHYATLFNTISILETIGQLIAGPLLAKSFRTGLDLDGTWIGLPFDVAGIFFSTAAITMLLIRLPRPVEDTRSTNPFDEEADENMGESRVV